MEVLNYIFVLILAGIVLYVFIKPFLPAYGGKKKLVKLKMDIGHGIELLSHVDHDAYYFPDVIEFDESKGILTFTTVKEEVVKLHFDNGMPFLPQNLYAIRFKLNGQIFVKFYDTESNEEDTATLV